MPPMVIVNKCASISWLYKNGLLLLAYSELNLIYTVRENIAGAS
jgi:hypothetical protein